MSAVVRRGPPATVSHELGRTLSSAFGVVRTTAELGEKIVIIGLNAAENKLQSQERQQFAAHHDNVLLKVEQLEIYDELYAQKNLDLADFLETEADRKFYELLKQR